LKKEKKDWGDEASEERLGKEGSEQYGIEVSKRDGLNGVQNN
jgi:hypothetical protein